MPSVTVRVTDASGNTFSKAATFGTLMASTLFRSVGFAGDALDVFLGVTYMESWDSVTKLGGYADAVGDIGKIDAKWGCSDGFAQIRTLRNPYIWGPLDRWRDATKLQDITFQAQASWALSKQGTDFTPWSVFNSKTYLDRLGMDYPLRYGHSQASHWFD